MAKQFRLRDKLPSTEDPCTPLNFHRRARSAHADPGKTPRPKAHCRRNIDNGGHCRSAKWTSMKGRAMRGFRKSRRLSAGSGSSTTLSAAPQQTDTGGLSQTPPDRSSANSESPAADAPVIDDAAWPDRVGHLGPNSRLSPRLRLRPATFHASGRPAGSGGARQCVRGR
jgi:hypothetical protein